MLVCWITNCVPRQGSQTSVRKGWRAGPVAATGPGGGTHDMSQAGNKGKYRVAPDARPWTIASLSFLACSALLAGRTRGIRPEIFDVIKYLHEWEPTRRWSRTSAASPARSSARGGKRVWSVRVCLADTEVLQKVTKGAPCCRAKGAVTGGLCTRGERAPWGRGIMVGGGTGTRSSARAFPLHGWGVIGLPRSPRGREGLQLDRKGAKVHRARRRLERCAAAASAWGWGWARARAGAMARVSVGSCAATSTASAAAVTVMMVESTTARGRARGARIACAEKRRERVRGGVMRHGELVEGLEDVSDRKATGGIGGGVSSAFAVAIAVVFVVVVVGGVVVVGVDVVDVARRVCRDGGSGAPRGGGGSGRRGRGWSKERVNELDEVAAAAGARGARVRRGGRHDVDGVLARMAPPVLPRRGGHGRRSCCKLRWGYGWAPVAEARRCAAECVERVVVVVMEVGEEMAVAV